MKHLLALFGILLLSQTGTARTPEVLTLESYLRSVEADSPELKIEQASRDESAARATGIRLSPPMLGFMNMKDGAGNNQGIEFSQEIPFPTKLSQEKEIRELESETRNASFQYRRTEILLSAKAAYFDFWKAFNKLEITKEKRDWLKSHSRISRSATRSDSAAQIHLLGVESEVDLLENEVLEGQTVLIEKRNALKTYATGLSDSEFTPVEPALESLELKSNSKSAFVAWKERELKASEAMAAFSTKAYLPDLYVRYRGYNGNEMAPRSEELMLGITLPFLYFWQPRAESNEASAKTQRAEGELRKARVDSETRVASLVEKLSSLKKQLSTLNDKLIPKAHKRMRLVENLSQRSMEVLDEHRTVMLDYIELKMKALEARYDYEVTSIEIQKLTSPEVNP